MRRNKQSNKKIDKYINIFRVIFIVTFFLNVIVFFQKHNNVLSKLNYKVLVQDSAGSDNYIEYTGNLFPRKGYVLSSYTCDTDATITQNAINKKLSFTGPANRCTLKFDVYTASPGQTLSKLQELSSQWSVNDGTPNLNVSSPRIYYIDRGFSGSETKANVTGTNYITYASSYTFNTDTGEYTLTNPTTCRFNSYTCRSTVEGKYIVSPSGNSSSSAASSNNLDKIYKVTDTDGTFTGIYYITTTTSITANNHDSSECGIWQDEDDYGNTYYVRGAYDYNYVKFGMNSNDQDLYWRIIRINGDESLRLMYAGPSASAKSNIGTSAFNTNINDNAYVGYMYGQLGASSYNLTHANTTNSTIKNVIDNYYKENLSDYYDFLSDTLFCNNRSLHSGNGFGTETTYYGFDDYEYSFKCKQKNDAFTVDDTENGNGKLTYPIGMITADEIVRGGITGTAAYNTNYLTKDYVYFTMTPHDYANNSAYIFGVTQANILAGGNANNVSGVVPVINLSAETVQAFEGTGTSSDPFVVNKESISTSTPEAIIENSSLNTLHKLQTRNSNIVVSTNKPDFGSTETLDGGIFIAEDDYGTSYYWRGAASTNYIKFGDWYWQIIRINGNGSLRLLYIGTDPNVSSYVYSSSYFNERYNDNAFVGYMRGQSGSSTYSATHANTNSSRIKMNLEDWYTNNIKGKSFEKYISDTVFCYDRSIIDSSSGNGTTDNQTFYAPRTRNYDNKNPSLKCKNQNDRFTVSDSSFGNAALSKPIGLITLDEAALAGMVNMISNNKAYTYKGFSYWTGSPSSFTSNKAYVAYITASGALNSQSVDTTANVVPVINIKPSALDNITGSGTSTDPFVVH